jgi:membrane protease YdiL (CAAX protease family)
MKVLSNIPGAWHSLPVVVRAILTGFIVTAAGTTPWAILASLNLKHWPEFPWAVPLTALYIWGFWKYVRGAGWPKSTAEARNKNCRAHDLSADAWAAAIGAGILGLWSLLLFQNIYGRLVTLPMPTEDLSDVPVFTLVASLIMSAIVAGTTEESGLRGYMQRPLEQRYGPTVAILLTGTIFGLMHFTHREVTFALMPWYMGVALVYGALAYITDSIMPGVVLHAGGNMLGAIQLFGNGRSEWQTELTRKPLIWESGPDASFWITCVGFVVLTTATVWAYSMLGRTVSRSQP